MVNCVGGQPNRAGAGPHCQGTVFPWVRRSKVMFRRAGRGLRIGYGRSLAGGVVF